jgi:hypothetical protein
MEATMFNTIGNKKRGMNSKQNFLLRASHPCLIPPLLERSPPIQEAHPFLNIPMPKNNPYIENKMLSLKIHPVLYSSLFGEGWKKYLFLSMEHPSISCREQLCLYWAFSSKVPDVDNNSMLLIYS